MNYKINNHLKVTLTKKATGESVVLYDDTKLQNGFDGVNYTSRPQGQDGKLSAAPPFVESVDDQFFSAVLVLNESSQSLYDIFDPVKVEVTSNGKTTTQHYLVGGNGTALQDARNTTCEKTINLIEPTKILTRYPIFNLNLTSKKDTLLRQFEKALNNSVLLLDDDECPFALSEELTEMLTGLPSEDFFFSDTNLYAVLFEMLSVIDCRPFVKKVEIDSLTKNFKTIVIDALKMSETHDEVFTPSTDQTKPEENHGVYISQERSNDGNDYMGKIVARGYNSVSNAPLTIIDAFKSDSETISTDNAFAFLPFPIERIQRFVFVGVVTVYVADTSGVLINHTTKDISIKKDISKHLITDEEFGVLSQTEQREYLPYSLGGNAIGLGEKYKLPFSITSYNINDILSNYALEIYKSEVPNWEDSLTNFVDYVKVKNIAKCTFECEYIPRLDTAMETRKPAVYDIDRLRLGIQDTQSANTIDIVRHGKNIEGLVRRTGNDEITMDMLVENFDQVYPLMTRFVGGDFDDYVIWQREYSVASQNIKVRYSLTKGFNRVATKLGVKRERHIFSIPTASEDCPLIVKHYAVFKTTENRFTPINSLITDENYFKEFANNLICIGERGNKYPIESIQFSTPEAFNSYESEGASHGATLNNGAQVLKLPCVGYCSGKSITFMAQPLDNYSAGYQRGKRVKFSLWGGGGTKILYTPYCDMAGESTSFNVKLGGGVDNDDLATLPVAMGQYISSDINVKYHKDRTQRPVFFFNIECVPSKAEYGKIIIGEKFLQENFLLAQNKGKATPLYLYLSDETYNEGDTLCKGTKKGLAGSWLYSELLFSHYVLTLKTNMANTTNEGKAWAIGDADGNLYLAVNKQLPNEYNAVALTIQFRKTTELGR